MDLLAQIDTSFLETPLGKGVAIAGAVVVGIIVLVILFKALKWTAARSKTIITVAVVVGLIYVGFVMLVEMGPEMWIITTLVAFGAMVGFALFMTHR